MTSSEFWEERYQNNKTPWDYGGVPPELSDYLRGRAVGDVLVPGCGSGHELVPLAAVARRLSACDLSPSAVAIARSRLPADQAKQVGVGDFFQIQEKEDYDLIYERTFLCALDLNLRSVYQKKMAALLRKGGQLVGYFVYGEEMNEDGPPFGLPVEQRENFLEPDFVLRESQPSHQPLELFSGFEYWQIWEKI